jgi:hypothetical protein
MQRAAIALLAAACAAYAEDETWPGALERAASGLDGANADAARRTIDTLLEEHEQAALEHLERTVLPRRSSAGWAGRSPRPRE